MQFSSIFHKTTEVRCYELAIGRDEAGGDGCKNWSFPNTHTTYIYTHTHTQMMTVCVFSQTGLVSGDADVALTNSAAPIKKITKDKGWTTHTHTHTYNSEAIPLSTVI